MAADEDAILLSEVVTPPAPPPLVSPPFAAVAEQPGAQPASERRKPPRAAAPSAPPAAVERELVVPEGTRYTGEVLRRAREARGLTVAQICERTKVSRHHIDNLEADRYDKLPAPVYLRGILLTLAKELRLDGQKVARSYMDAHEGGEAAGEDPARRRVDRARTVK